jgi:branched-chain amino acid transport system ATP-binding protein
MVKGINVKSGYSGVTVLHDLKFDVGHEIFAILGANGAGKSTLMKTIAKVLPLSGGEIFFKEENVSKIPPYYLAEKGLAYVPQENNVFPDMTVYENLSIGSLIGKRSKKERIEEIFELFPGILDRVNQKAGSLSGGETQMVAVGRALMQDPSMILLDEPTSGLAPKYVDTLFTNILEIHKKKNVSIMVAEQNASKALEVADRIMVLHLGKIFLIDDSKNIDINTIKEGYRI